MIEEVEKNKQEEFEANQSLVGFFELLLEVDRRINPHLYEDNRDTNSPN